MNQNMGNCSSGCNSLQNRMQNSYNRCNRENSFTNSCNRRNCDNSSSNPCNRFNYNNGSSNSCNQCNCEDSSTMCTDPLRGMPIGIGYVPWQEWGCVYDYEEGLCRGTIFPPLDLPFYGCIPRGFNTNKGGNA